MFTQSPQEFVDAITDFSGAARTSNLPFDEAVNAGQSPYLAQARSRWNFVAARTKLNPTVRVGSQRVRYALDNSLKKIDNLVPDARQRKINEAMKARVAQFVGEKYKESNRITSEASGYDLFQFGYDM